MQEQTKGVQTFIRLLINEFDMDEKELNEIWDKYLKTVDIIEEKKENQFTHSELRKLKKKELEELCKSNGVSHTGTKQVLISRLLGDKPAPTQTSKKTKAPTSRDIFQMIKNPSSIHIRRNVFGNYEHMDSGLVFDEISKKVIGKQHTDGTIIPLASQDIDVCKNYLFNYEIPYTLRDVYEN